MNWKAKAGIVGGVLLVLGILAFIIKVQHDSIEKLKAIETSVVESKDLGDGLVRSEAKYMTKEDLERIIKEQGLDLQVIKKDLKKLGAKPVATHEVRVVTPGFSGTNIPTTDTTPNPNPDPPKAGDSVLDKYGYFGATQWVELKEPFEGGTELPYGRVGFSAWEKDPWSIEVKPREYSSVTVLGQDEDGRHYAYSQFQVTVDGETQKVDITESQIVEKYPSAKFRWDPAMYMAVDFGLVANPPAHAEVTPNLGVTLFSYGKTKLHPTFTFVGIGLGYATQTQAPVLMLAPVNYNIGEPLPLIKNLYIGPSLSLDVDGNIGIYGGIRVSL